MACATRPGHCERHSLWPLMPHGDPSAVCDHEGCDREFAKWEGYRGDYCSARCHRRARAARLIEEIHRSRRRCATCYRLVATVEEARASDPPHFSGLKYETEHAERAVDDFSDDRYTRDEGVRWGCECGAANPQEDHKDVLIPDADELDLTGLVAEVLREVDPDG